MKVVIRILKWLAVIALLAVAAAVLFAGVTGEQSISPPSLTSEPFVAVRFDNGYPADNPQHISVEVDDASTVKTLASLIENGVQVDQHRCQIGGDLVFIRDDGSEVSIQITPGHRPEFYEFRHDGGLFVMNRVVFVSAMQPFELTHRELEIDEMPRRWVIGREAALLESFRQAVPDRPLHVSDDTWRYQGAPGRYPVVEYLFTQKVDGSPQFTHHLLVFDKDDRYLGHYDLGQRLGEQGVGWYDGEMALTLEDESGRVFDFSNGPPDGPSQGDAMPFVPVDESPAGEND